MGDLPVPAAVVAVAIIVLTACGSEDQRRPSAEELAGVEVSASCTGLSVTIEDFKQGKVTIEQARENLARSAEGANRAAEVDARYAPIATDFDRLLSRFEMSDSPADVGAAVTAVRQSCAALAPFDELR